MIQLSKVTIDKIDGIYKVFCESENIVNHQDRLSHMLVIVLKGSIVIRQGRRLRTIDEKHAGIIPSNAKYRLYNHPDTEMIFIEFTASNFNVKRPETVSIEDVALVKELAMKSENIWSKGAANYNIICLANIYSIFSDLAIDIKRKYIEAKRIELIERSLRYLHDNFTELEISNENLAKISGISVVYFRKLFTAAYGVPPMRYVQGLRMRKAKELLPSGYYSVTEVSQMTGFSSIYSFSKTFKSVHGTSPNSHRSKKK